MAKVTTRGGDSGYTGLLGAERVPKYASRVEALGHLDEATSCLGVARAATSDERARGLILAFQRSLYRLMAEVASTPETMTRLSVGAVSAADVDDLERISEELKREVEIGHRFIIPGESLPGASLDVARAVVRRSERQLARMVHEGEIANGEVLRFVNRLSDVLFVLARYLERDLTREMA
jgi:cob(I)alamin adenosyltransferase